jgi:hypothetical protein
VPILALMDVMEIQLIMFVKSVVRYVQHVMVVQPITVYPVL